MPKMLPSLPPAKLNKESGQSFFEVVVALAVVAIILVALVSLATVSVRNVTFSRNQTLANRYTQQAIEWLRGQRDQDWTAFVARASPAGQTWCISADPPAWPNVFGACGSTDFLPDTLFLREVVLTTTVGPGGTAVEAQVATSWTDSQGVHEARSSTFFTDWRAE